MPTRTTTPTVTVCPHILKLSQTPKIPQPPEKSERVMTAEIVANAENAARGAGFDTEPIDTEERVSSAPVTDVHGENANDTDNSVITEAAGAQTGSASNNNGQGIPSVGVQLDSNAAALGSPGHSPLSEQRTPTVYRRQLTEPAVRLSPTTYALRISPQQRR